MMKQGRAKVTRRGLGALLAGAAGAAKAAQDQPKTPADEARESRASDRRRIKAVEIAREVEPSFRFEP